MPPPARGRHRCWQVICEWTSAPRRALARAGRRRRRRVRGRGERKREKRSGRQASWSPAVPASAGAPEDAAAAASRRRRRGRYAFRRALAARGQAAAASRRRRRGRGEEGGGHDVPAPARAARMPVRGEACRLRRPGTHGSAHPSPVRTILRRAGRPPLPHQGANSGRARHWKGMIGHARPCRPPDALLWFPSFPGRGGTDR